jgi:hypothetical protein
VFPPTGEELKANQQQKGSRVILAQWTTLGEVPAPLRDNYPMYEVHPEPPAVAHTYLYRHPDGSVIFLTGPDEVRGNGIGASWRDL